MVRYCYAGCIVFVLLFWLYCSGVKAEEESDVLASELDVTEEITVIAVPIIEENPVTEDGAVTTRVTEQQIDALRANDLPTALRRVPGVQISRHNPVGSYGGGEGGSIYIRGMGSGRPGSEITYLTDGVPRFVGVWTHSLMDILPVDFTEAITIYKGAQPVHHGNMSFGSIELSSKSVDSDGITTRIRVGGGEYNTFMETFEHGFRAGAADYYFGQSYKRSDGHREHAGGQLRNYYLHGAYRFGSSFEIEVKGHFADTSADDPGPVGVIPERGRFDVEDRLGIVNLNHQHNALSGSFTFYYDDGLINWQQWDAEAGEAFDTDTEWDNYGFRYAGTAAIGTTGQLDIGYDHDIYGGGYQEVTAERVRVDKSRASFRNTGPFASFLYSWGTTVIVTPSLGVRYTDNSVFDPIWAPQAGLRVSFGQTVLHGFLSRGFNYPGLYARFMTENWGGGESWQDLGPELVDHWEVGFNQKIGSSLIASATYFHDKGQDKLEFIAPPPPPPSFDNIEEFTVEGFEASFVFDGSPYFSSFLGGSILKTEPDDLPNSPEYTVTAAIGTAIIPQISLHLDAEWIGERYNYNSRFPGERIKLDSYSLVNARVNYSPHFLSGCSLWMSLENITDEAYAYKDDYPMPGRTVSGGLDIRF